jgi:hypothetical protein
MSHNFKLSGQGILMFEPVVANLITSAARMVTGARSLWLGCARR